MGQPGVMLYFDLRPALKRLTAEEKGLLLEAILDYGEDGLLPDLDGAVGVAWDFIQPRIDADATRYRAKCKQSQEAARSRWHKQDATACGRIPAHADYANYNYNDNSTPTTTTTTTTDDHKSSSSLIRVLRYYAERVGAGLSQTAAKQLSNYVAQMGADVCCRAIDVAIDAGKGNWGYVAGVLSNKQAQGVRSLDDWQRVEQERGSDDDDYWTK